MLAPFTGQVFDDGAYGLPSVELTNWYVEAALDRPDRQYRLIPTAGLAPFANGGNNQGVTGLGFADNFGTQGNLLVHSGATLRAYDRNGALTGQYAVGATQGKSRFASSELDLVLGTGTAAYIINEGQTSPAQVSLPNGRPIVDIAEIGQRHIYVEQSSGRIWYSAVADASTVLADAFITAEDEADELRAVRSFQNSLFLYGSRSIQVLRPSGNESSPFYPSPAGTLPKGVIGRSAVTIADFGQFFVGDDNIVYRLSGYQAERISTHWIERSIQALSYEDRAEISLTSYAWEGHTFLSLRLPDKGTYNYDAATQLWHREQSYQSETSRRTSYQEAWGNVFVGDAFGSVSVLDRNTGDELGEPIVRVATTLVPVQDNRPDISNIVIEGQSGLGTTTGLDAAPIIEIRLSEDGRRWRHWQQGNIGAIGDFKRKTVFGPFGRMEPPFFAVQIRYSGGLPIALSALRINQARP